MIEVRLAEGQDHARAVRRLQAEWGGPEVIAHGRRFLLSDCRILAADGDLGFLAFEAAAPPAAEIVALNALVPRRGTGTALLSALGRLLRTQGFTALHVTTTNDNLDALRFYQRRGFRLHALRVGAVTEARRLKPTIPMSGAYGLPIRDEIELTLDLTSGS